MKKLMIATAVAAVGLSAVADVYNIKFAAKTPVDAVNKKGEATTSLKSITIQGLWDTANTNYLFWSVNGKEYKALKNATLALVSEGKFVKNDVLNNAQVAEEYELLWGENGWGDDVTKLEGAFVASGLTKNKVAKDGTVTLTSMSGNFAGQQDGKPAYGTWTLSKNAKATKDGLLAGLPKQLADVDPSAFGEKYADLSAWKKSMNGADETEGALADANNEFAKLDTKWKEAVGAIEDLNVALKDTQDNLTQANDTLKEKEKEYQALLRRFKDCEKKAMEYLNGWEAAKIEVGANSEEAKKFEKLYNEAQTLADQLSEQLAAAEADRDAANAEKEQLAAEKNQLAAEKNQLTTDLEGVQATLNSIKENVKDLNDKTLLEPISDYLEKQLASQKNLNAEAQAELAAFNADNPSKGYIDDVIAEAQAALAASNAVYETLTNAANAANADYKDKRKIFEEMEEILAAGAYIQESNYFKKNYVKPIEDADKAIADYKKYGDQKTALVAASNSVTAAENAFAVAMIAEQQKKMALEEATGDVKDAQDNLDAFEAEINVDPPTFAEYKNADANRKDDLATRLAWEKHCLDLVKQANEGKAQEYANLLAQLTAAQAAEEVAQTDYDNALADSEKADQDLKTAQTNLAAAEVSYPDGLKALEDYKASLERARDTFLATKLPSDAELALAKQAKEEALAAKDAANKAVRNEKGYIFAQAELDNLIAQYNQNVTIKYGNEEVTVNPYTDRDNYEKARLAYISQLQEIITKSEDLVEMLETVLAQIAEVL